MVDALSESLPRGCTRAILDRPYALEFGRCGPDGWEGLQAVCPGGREGRGPCHKNGHRSNSLCRKVKSFPPQAAWATATTSFTPPGV